jgi:hypothetical protein
MILLPGGSLVLAARRNEVSGDWAGRLLARC